MEGGSSISDFESWMKESLGLERFSLKRLSAAGSLSGDPEKGSGDGHLFP